MQPEVVTRFRNSFAHLLLELMSEAPSKGVTTSFELPFSSMTEADWRRAVELWNVHAAELLAPLPDRPCPACGSARSRWLFESYDAHQFHECEQCGCWFTPKVVDWSVFERLFRISPEAQKHAAAMMGERDDESGRAVDMGRIGAYFDELLPFVPKQDGQPIRYLDTGCGVGHSLRAGLDRGLVVQGVEVDDAAVALARKAGLPVATLSEVDAMPRGPYQLLTFWETLEHIAEPLEALQRFVPFLADDGLVAITVPNLNAPATRAMREACVWVHGGYNTPGHVNLFHVHALERLLARAGLTLIDAEGQFSGNPLELLAFMGGESRGAFDVLQPTATRGQVPALLGPLLTDVWPGMALIEQYTLSSPILRVVACRKGQESRFAGAVASRKEARMKRLAEEARHLISFEVDYKARSEYYIQFSEDRQAETNRRDDLLREKEAHFQGEIQLRDQMLSELRTKWESSLSFKVERLIAKLTGKG
jgi:2-polyprenyl-3-methyl-5-hydroxy-6-metoxy-1,4-benzoquinol methylase